MHMKILILMYPTRDECEYEGMKIGKKLKTRSSYCPQEEAAMVEEQLEVS